jgi:hypothetical protein
VSVAGLSRGTADVQLTSTRKYEWKRAWISKARSSSLLLTTSVVVRPSRSSVTL